MADTVNLHIESLNVEGDGMARHARRPVAVPFTIPGERVRVHLGPTREGVTSAVLVEVLHASPHRVRPACRHFGPDADAGRICGGCSWQHIAYAEQLRLKTDLVTRLVREAVPSTPPARLMRSAVPQDAPWQYRNKVHFVVGAAGRSGSLVMGHYARFSRRVIPVTECPVHDARGNAVAFLLLDACRQAGARSVKGIAARTSCASSETMATLVVTTDMEKSLRTAGRRALAGPAAPTSLHVNLHPRADGFVFGRNTRRVAGPERLREEVGGVSFLISPTAFFQTNVRAAEILVREVLGNVPAGATVLDLYAGAGLLGLPLALRGHHVVAVEENRSAVADGEASMRLSRVPEERCRFVPQPVEVALGTGRRLASQAFDTVVLDPPREGCTASVLDDVFDRLRPTTAIYVSCDPQSLARDLARITPHGYVIASLQPVDMFPHTPHIETVVVLTREGRVSAPAEAHALRHGRTHFTAVARGFPFSTT